MPIDTNDVSKLISALPTSGPKGVDKVDNDKGIRKPVPVKEKIKDLIKTKPNLESAEVTRYGKIAELFKKVLFPKAEANILESDKKPPALPISIPSKDNEKVPEKQTSWLKKLIGPALLVLGGLSAFVAGIMSDGPAKGLLKILAKVGIGGGVKWFASIFKRLGKNITGIFSSIGKTLTKLPLLKGFKLGTLLKDKLAEGLTLIKKKISTVFSSIKGVLLKPFKALKGGAIGGIFKKVGGMLFNLLKPILKRIPGIGSMISWAFAVSRFKSGDVVGGLIDVASGIATLFPGVGTAIGIGLDVLNAFLDTKKGKEEKVKPAGSGFKMSDFFGKIKDKIMNNFPIKNLVEFWSGAGMVMSGNFKEGFKRMAFALPFMEPLSDWLFGTTDAETGIQSSGKMDIFSNIKDILIKRIISIFPEKILGVSVRGRIAEMFGVDMGPIVDDMEQAPVKEQTGVVTASASRKAKEKAWGSAEAAVPLNTIEKGVKGTSLEKSEEWKHVQGAVPYLKKLREQHAEYMQKGDKGEADRIAIEIMKREQWKENALKSLHDKIDRQSTDSNKTNIVKEPKTKPESVTKSVVKEPKTKPESVTKSVVKEPKTKPEGVTKLGNIVKEPKTQPKNITKSVVKESKTQPVNVEIPKKLNDFLISKNGEVQSFDTQDELLGLKRGGAIDKLINSNNTEIKNLNERLVNLGVEQTKLLQEIAVNTRGSNNMQLSRPTPQQQVLESNNKAELFELNIRGGFTEPYTSFA